MANPNASKLLGVVGDTAMAQLLREQKRVQRGAPNAIAVVDGELDDGVLIAIVTDGTDLTGYLPVVTPDP